MRKHVKSVAKVEFGPVAVPDSALEVVGRTLPGPVVLHSAVHVVRKLVVDVDVVKLREGQVFDKAPALAAVAADVVISNVIISEPPSVLIKVVLLIAPNPAPNPTGKLIFLLKFIDQGLNVISYSYILEVYIHNLVEVFAMSLLPNPELYKKVLVLVDESYPYIPPSGELNISEQVCTFVIESQ